ncbi:MAG: carboxysome shell carbonic anhydrase [Thiotrichales bacterium]
MNTRNAYALRARLTSQANQRRHGASSVSATQGSARHPETSRSRRRGEPLALQRSERGSSVEENSRHPLTDGFMNARLARCEESVKGRFEAIVPALKEIAGLQHEADFAGRAQAMAKERLGYELPDGVLEDAWVSGLDLKALYAHCAFRALRISAAQFAEDLKNQVEAVHDTRNFFLECGFHAIDISPCADGRLKGLMRYILRLPLSSFVHRKAYAGALFDVEGDVRDWVGTELRRFREGIPTTADAGTRYLKIAVYHTSSSDPCHQGCAAHGSSEVRAIDAALERLNQFRQAIENAFCCGATTDILLIGVDTDTDSIRVHVPDANGDLSAHRYVDNAGLYAKTQVMDANSARLAVYEAVEAAVTDGGNPHDGMRRLIVNLLINNLSQIDYVLQLYGGRYPDIGHAERYISVGDGFEEVQMRNIAYYAHLHTLEEGSADMDVGIKIFKGLNVKHGLPIPVAIHYRYDARVPGSRDRTINKAMRVRDAVESRYADLVRQRILVCHLSVQDTPIGSAIEEIAKG